MVDSGSGAAYRSRRWPLLAMVVAVALLFGYVFTHRIADVDTDAGTEQEEALPELTGPRGVGPAGLLVLVGGQTARVLDTHTGVLEPLAGLRTESDDRALVRPVPTGVLATVTNDRGSRTDLLRDGTAVPLGVGVTVVPTRTGGFAVASQRNGQTSVLLRTAGGDTRLRWSIRGLAVPVRDTVAGLVLSRLLRTGSTGRDLLLVDPRTGAERRLLGTDRVLLGSTDTLVAHRSGSCTLNCPVTISDLTNGTERELPVVMGPAAAAGTLDPDGRRLALSVPGDYLDGRTLRRFGFVAVQDVEDGRAMVVPGVRTPPAQHADVDWSPDGSVLVVAVWWASRGTIGLWSPDRPADPPVVLETRPPGDRTAGIAATSD